MDIEDLLKGKLRSGTGTIIMTNTTMKSCIAVTNKTTIIMERASSYATGHNKMEMIGHYSIPSRIKRRC